MGNVLYLRRGERVNESKKNQKIKNSALFFMPIVDIYYGFEFVFNGIC